MTEAELAEADHENDNTTGATKGDVNENAALHNLPNQHQIKEQNP